MRASAYGVGIALTLLILGVGAIVVFFVPTPPALPPVDLEAAEVSGHGDPAPAVPTTSVVNGRERTPPPRPSPTAAGESGEGPAVEDTSPGSLVGRIVVAGAGTPVAGVIVSVRGTGSGGRARTTPDGYFRLSDLRPGIYRLSARTYEIPQITNRIVWVRPGRETTVLIEADAGIRLHGRVTDAVTGRGIVEASIVVRGGSHGAADTDEAGHYEIKGLGIGARIEVEAEGYAPPPARWIRGLDRPGEVRIDFALSPPASIEGRVVGPSREPVPRAGVFVYRADRGSGLSGMADEAGRFRITGLPAGVRLHVHASSAGFVPARVDVGSLEARETRSGVIVALSRGAVIAGRVIEPEGDTALEGLVRLDRVGHVSLRSAGRQARIEKDGTFRFKGVPPGRYTISVRHPEFLLHESVDVEVAEGSRHEAIEIKLAEGLSIAGRLLDPDGNPVKRARIEAVPAGVPSPLLLGVHHGVDAFLDGTFEITGLWPGRYRLLAWLWPYGAAQQPEPIVQAGAQDVVVRFSKRSWVSGPREGRIEGRVRHSGRGKPVMGFCVRCWRVEGGPMHRRQFADPEGRFCLQRLLPGTFLVMASTSDGAVTPEPVRVVVDPEGETPSIELCLGPSAEVEGRVLSPEGTPLAGADIVVLWRLGDQNFTESRTFSSRDGRYRASGLVPGSHVIRASSPHCNACARPFFVTAGQTQTVDLQLSSGHGRVQVAVRDPAGRPIRDATVGMLRSDQLGPYRSLDPQRRFTSWPLGPVRSVPAILRRTDSSGEAAFIGIAPGKYAVQVYKPGLGYHAKPTAVYEHVTTRVHVVLSRVE